MTSEEAIPKPDINPDFQFLLTVRLIQSIPNGPNGTDTAMPIIKPSQSRLKLIKAKIAEINDLKYSKSKDKGKISHDIFYFYPERSFNNKLKNKTNKNSYALPPKNNNKWLLVLTPGM